QITDITGLSALTNLTSLGLGNNQITDLTSLSGLTNLTHLNLEYNQITDITGLSALTNLTELSLKYNQITDITSLSALTNLTKLRLYINQITDITGLSALTNLTELYLSNNKITDITGLSALTNLTILYLDSNQITDISPLSALTNLTKLDLIANQISDITSLSALTNLTELKLYNNKITDITWLSALTNLTSLAIGDNQITDITSLSALTNLTELSLDSNQITDITSLSALTNLTDLDLDSNQITNITSLSALINLTELSLYNNRITDIAGLSGLTNLIDLSLKYNQITDITGLSGLTNLTLLYLDSNQITDITGLAALTNLIELSLRDNQITYFNLSRELRQKYLTLSTTPIDALKATETVKKIYAAIGREAPQVIVCSSPQVASIKLPKQLKISWISQLQKWEIGVGNLVRRNRLLDELFQGLYLGCSGEVWRRVLWQERRLEQSVDNILDSEFQDLVANYGESLGGDIMAEPYYLRPLTPTERVEEIHWIEFLIAKFGIPLDQKAQELFRCKQQLFEDCGWIFPFEKVCLVCDRPLHIRFDAENRLHAEGEPAIAFADGYSLYFHHGLKLPEKYGKVHPDLWEAQWLLFEENAELRRLLIQRIGYDRICQELEVTELDSWQEYTLLSIEFDDDFDDEGNAKPIYLLKMTCPSTGHIHALRVPPNVRSAQEAIRWVNWDIDLEEFSVQT
ncbi:leucine-rich repeat domain-containing protein, partial [Microcoleus sp. K5-D4]|uniref:leucine-rich repeat domain-containing protein n=1 Tax=Microcoleus sp. K5-D4 TaxID=2818801 RepID=UPI002FD3CFCC